MKSPDPVPGVDFNLVERRMVAEHQGGVISVADMMRINGLQIDVRDDVPVDDHKGVGFPEIQCIANGAAGAENAGFKFQENRNLVTLMRYEVFDFFMKMVGVDHHGPASGLDQTPNGDIEQPSPADGKQGLGRVLSEGKQSGAESGGQYQCFHESRSVD